MRRPQLLPLLSLFASRSAARVFGAVLLCACTGVLAADDPFDKVKAQAAVLDAAPVLTEGSVALPADALAEGAFVWVEVPVDGLYRLALSTPGSLVLGSLPTADGRYDGRTPPVLHADVVATDEAPQLGPVLLSEAHPYLVSVSGNDGDAELVLQRLESLPKLAGALPRNEPVGPGSTLLAVDKPLTLRLPGDVASRRIEVIGEARADLDARLDGVGIPAGGRYPWVHEDDATLTIRAGAGKGSAPPRVLVRVGPSPVTLDEFEPNEKQPNPLSPETPFRGHLLDGDEDRLAFSLSSAARVGFTIDAETARDRVQVRLLRLLPKREELLWQREPAGTAWADEAWSLDAGDYRVEIRRSGGEPGPVPYTLRMTRAAEPGANEEQEPNDTREAAMDLPASMRVSGSAAADDTDVFRIEIPDHRADHLWRLFAVGAESLLLTHRDGTLAKVRADGRRSMVDSLALVPGEYWVEVQADGDYLLRLMDLGPRPEDFEGEPNDSSADGQRLTFGKVVRGGFHHQDDIDHYLFRLDAESPVRIHLRPVADGESDVGLSLENDQLGNRVRFAAGDPDYRFESRLPAGDWTLMVRAQGGALSETYEVGVERLAALAGQEPDDLPGQAARLPLDGWFSGSVGGFDGADQVFVPLPQGEGTAALLCDHDRSLRPALWRLHHFADDARVADVRDGIALFDYAPALGGALRLAMAGTHQPIDYACALRFVPETLPAAQPAEPVAADDAVYALAAGETRRVTIPAEGPEPRFALALAPEQIAFVTCRDESGAVLAPESRVWDLSGVREPVRERLGELSPLVAEDDPRLTFSRTYAGRLDGGRLPMTVACTLLATEHLAGPGAMGPAAPFTAFAQASADGGEAATEVPPGLEAMLAKEAPARQARGDLPVRLTLTELPTLAAFNDAGQRFTATLAVESLAPGPLSLQLDLSVDGEGWRLVEGERSLTLVPGETATVAAVVEAPPWLSPALAPALVARAEAADSFAATLHPIPVDAAALPREPFTYWHAPAALRGGLNVLHYGLGARIAAWGGQTLNERDQVRESALHDGLAPHVGSVNLPPDVTFDLAATAELAGAMVQLRSTGGAGAWPAEVNVLVPAPEGGWRRVANSALASIHEPQYVVFEQPVTTDRLRFTFPRCRTKCAQVFIQELQAIATPGSHPDALAPINAADPALGGHVIWASESHGGAWNSDFLVGDPAASNGGWKRTRDGSPQWVTVAFHQNRAAWLSSLTWVADPDDTERFPHAEVEASVDGPAGPWLAIGRLPSPAAGETRATLDFEQPVWARYLRLRFDRPDNVQRYGPDAIEALEVPGTSVLGLWEDDQPRAAFEAAHRTEPPAAVPPAGGADRDAAVALVPGTAVRSSVVIERNEDWWRLHVPPGPMQALRLQFERPLPLVVAELEDDTGKPVALAEVDGPATLEARLAPGTYFLRVFEPPRSVVITWDTSGSVSHYIPRTLAAVRTWARGLKVGRDALQLLPFGAPGFLLDDFAESPDEVEPALRALPEEASSDSEDALRRAAEALAERRGSRGIVIMTDAETGMKPALWPQLLRTMPRVVSLSVDSDSRANAAVMMDWANLNGGRFRRVIGPLGLADSMEMANALFRAPKAYGLVASLEAVVEVEGLAELAIVEGEGAQPTGGIELILDASGSMLKRLEGRRRIHIAHEALAGLVRETLPAGTPFAFRAFGLEEDACRSELMVPLAPLERESAARVIESVPAINLARTAIADSLRAAVGDLAGSTPPRVVVLVTDGEETCDGDVEAAIRELRAAGVDARVNIVGFAIDDEALAATFAGWAEAGGGTYFDASGAEALKQSVADALKPRFDVVRTYLDGRREVVAEAALGETVSVPAGNLSVVPAAAATGRPFTVQVAPDDRIRLRYTPDSGLGQAETGKGD